MPAKPQRVKVVPDRRRRRADLLPEEDRAVEALERHRERRGLELEEAVEQAADESPLGTTGPPRLPLACGRQRAERSVAREDPPIRVNEGLALCLRQLLPRSEPPCRQLRVDRDEPGLPVEGQIERRNIAEAEERLRIGPNGLEVDQIEVGERRPTAGRREDRADFGIAEQLVELGGHLLRPSGHPPVASVAIDQRGESDVNAECLDDRDRPIEQRHFLLFQRPRERGDRHRVAGTQGLWTKDRCHVLTVRYSRSERFGRLLRRSMQTTRNCGSERGRWIDEADLDRNGGSCACPQRAGRCRGRARRERGPRAHAAAAERDLRAVGVLAHRHRDHLRGTPDADGRRRRNRLRLRRPAGLHERSRRRERSAVTATRTASP